MSENFGFAGEWSSSQDEMQFQRFGFAGRGYDSAFADGCPPEKFLAWVAVAPSGRFVWWRPATTLRGAFRDWRRRRRGWVFYDGDGRRT